MTGIDEAYLRNLDEAMLEGLKDAQAGRTVSHERVKAWVESWGTENELPRPEPEGVQAKGR